MKIRLIYKSGNEELFKRVTSFDAGPTHFTVKYLVKESKWVRPHNGPPIWRHLESERTTFSQFLQSSGLAKVEVSE